MVFGPEKKALAKLLHMRCNECKATLEGRKARAHHRDVLGHQWQPAYACTACRQAFRKKKLFHAHAHTCPARDCGRGPPQSSPASESLPNNLEPAAHDDSNATICPSQSAYRQNISDEASNSVNTAAPAYEHAETVHVNAIVSMLSTALSLLDSGSSEAACSERGTMDVIEGNVEGVAGDPTQSTASMLDQSMVASASCVERTGYPGQSTAEVASCQQALPVCSPLGSEPTDIT
ncbi:hypothetical protein BD413DRAFT_1742 [Trametes elegans]|nr:hypothetical protein BD413DRAFT_1742 [Trametes elegans]